MFGHADVLAVPAGEAVHPEEPEPAAHVAQRDQSVAVADVDAEGTLLDAGRALPAVVGIAAEAVLVRALAGVVPAVGLGILRILEVEDEEAVLVRRHEDVGPAHFMVVRQVTPVGRPAADRQGRGSACVPSWPALRSQIRSGVYWYSVSVTA